MTIPETDAPIIPMDVDTSFRARMTQAFLEAENRLAQSPLGRLDPISAYPAINRATSALSQQPMTLMRIFNAYASDTAQAWTAAAARAWGVAVPGPIEPRADRRFADPAWADNPGYWWLRQQYLAWDKAIRDLAESADVDEHVRAKVRFLAGAVSDAISPTNSALTNPAVQQRAWQTGGMSLVKGASNLLDDLATNGGQPRQVKSGVHEVGRDMAVSPGKVVFRNELMELVQYSPTTDAVHEIPLLFSPPWINKYYVMDLAPGRSLVQWAVDHGHTVFLISYRNPDESMRSITLDDYLISGPVTALDVITEITGAPKVNFLGLCLGGTLTMATLAYLDAIGEDRINNATFLNTLVDFSEPGLLGVFTDEQTVSKLERTMAETGFLPAENMRLTFDLMRGNDLIWNYVVNNWLMGEDPPAFDLLAWNADSTRMPANMHSFYLRSCYLENQLARGVMELAGQSLNVKAIDQDLYFLAAEQDHIAPWQTSYLGALLPAGEVRFVLSNAGHIAGIVNPPNPKSKHWVAPDGPLPATADEWRASATMHPQTWWEDWAEWIGQRAGAMRRPPSIGSARYPALEDAPGTYIFGS